MRLIPCTPEHIRRIPMPAGREMDAIRAALSEAHRPILAQWARSLVDDEEVLAIFGITPRWPGVGEAWAFITDYARQMYPIHVIRSARRCLDLAEQQNMRRVQAAVLMDFAMGHRFLEGLGFEREGPPGMMRQFGINGVGDYTLYARIH